MLYFKSGLAALATLIVATTGVTAQQGPMPAEIAQKLHYSSISHLSNQFKKITGLTPSHFKKLKKKRLRNLDNL